jgi:hypothetical protein
VSETAQCPRRAHTDARESIAFTPPHQQRLRTTTPDKDAAVSPPMARGYCSRLGPLPYTTCSHQAYRLTLDLALRSSAAVLAQFRAGASRSTWLRHSSLHGAAGTKREQLLCVHVRSQEYMTTQTQWRSWICDTLRLRSADEGYAGSEHRALSTPPMSSGVARELSNCLKDALAREHVGTTQHVQFSFIVQ